MQKKITQVTSLDFLQGKQKQETLSQHEAGLWRNSEYFEEKVKSSSSRSLEPESFPTVSAVAMDLS